MKHFTSRLAAWDSKIWLGTIVLSIGSLIYGLINHFGLFGFTSTVVYEFLSFQKPLINYGKIIMRPEMLFQWPALALLKILPKDVSYSIALYSLEIGYLFLGFMVLGGLFYVYSKSDQKNYALHPLLVFAFTLQGTLFFTPAALVPVMLFTLAFYALLLRNDNDPIPGFLSLVVSLALVCGAYPMTAPLLFIFYVAWQKKKNDFLSRNLAWSMLLVALFSVIKLFYFDGSALFANFPPMEQFLAWESLGESLIYLAPLLIFSKKNSDTDNPFLHKYFFIATGTLLAFNIFERRLYPIIDDYAVVAPLLLYVFAAAALHIENKNITPAAIAFFAVLLALAGALCLDIPEINNLRKNLYSHHVMTEPRSALLILSLLLIFILQFNLIRKKEAGLSPVIWLVTGAGCFAALIEASKVAFSKNLMTGNNYQQHYSLKIAFIFAVVSWLISKEKIPVEPGDSLARPLVKAAPIIVFLWSLIGISNVHDWQRGLDQVKNAQLAGDGCFVVQSDFDKNQFLSAGIDQMSLPYISILMNGGWSVRRILFFQDGANPQSNPCEPRQSGLGYVYLGNETWNGKSSSWMLVPLLKGNFDFSALAQNPTN